MSEFALARVRQFSLFIATDDGGAYNLSRQACNLLVVASNNWVVRIEVADSPNALLKIEVYSIVNDHINHFMSCLDAENTYDGIYRGHEFYVKWFQNALLYIFAGCYVKCTRYMGSEWYEWHALILGVVKCIMGFCCWFECWGISFI